MSDTVSLSSVAVLGGSFNPLHFGHLRLAVEVYEALRPTRLDFVPCANPPHKRQSGLLPFELRFAMLKAATARHPEFYVNRLEAERSDFSFTADTLREYRRALPGAKIYFVLGSEDFAGLGGWREWNFLPELAELLVASRQGFDDGIFQATVRRLWPDARESVIPGADRAAFSVGKAGLISYLALPRLDVSASLIRARWLAGRSVDYLAPGAVLEILRENAGVVERHWSAQPSVVADD